jgi:flagellar M-ring protein FliF
MIVNGKQVSWQPRTQEEMQHLTELAQAAIGFDSARGDQVSVEDMAFEGNSTNASPSAVDQFLAGAAQSEVVWKYAALTAALFGLLFFVVRPVMRKGAMPEKAVSVTASEEPQLPAGDSASLQSDADESAEQHRRRAQLVFDSVAEHLRREPAQATRLLQSWIHTE